MPRCRPARSGYDGKWAIHPSQIPIANEVFSPTPDEVAEAREAMATYREAEAGGVGAIGRDGKLVDAAHMRLAANTLHKAALAEWVGRALGLTRAQSKLAHSGTGHGPKPVPP